MGKKQKQRKPRAQLTAVQLERMMREYQAGVEVKILAERYNVDRSTITYYRQKLGLPARAKTNRHFQLISPEELAEVQARLNETRQEVGGGVEEVG